MQSADKALRILSLFDEHHAERGVSELSRLLGVHKSTTSRMLAAMEARGFVARTGERYRLGPEIVRLGGLALHGLGLTDACRPAMASLAETTGETVNLAVADGGAALNIDQIGAAHLVGVTDWTGRRLPLAKTANGKVLAAFGAATIDAPSPELAEQIAQARRVGYAIAVEELEPGLVAVAAPVLDAGGGCVAAISVSGPLYRIGPARVVELAGHCLTAAGTASHRLGYRRSAA
jgi:DNA-binding IclR family transcriptional regulator